MFCVIINLMCHHRVYNEIAIIFVRSNMHIQILPMAVILRSAYAKDKFHFYYESYLILPNRDV